VLGNLEPFLLLSQMGRKDECALVLNEATSRLLAAIKSGGWRSAIPSQTLSNGLLTGVAGIGYGLLRLRCPGRVPSVLTLEGPMGSPAAKRKH
jgi:lantibiotic modifying enzyme